MFLEAPRKVRAQDPFDVLIQPWKFVIKTHLSHFYILSTLFLFQIFFYFKFLSVFGFCIRFSAMELSYCNTELITCKNQKFKTLQSVSPVIGIIKNVLFK